MFAACPTGIQVPEFIGAFLAGDETRAWEVIRAGDVLPPVLHLMPGFERPFVPRQVLPVVVPEDPWLETVKKVEETS